VPGASANDRLAAIAIRVMDELDRLLYLKQVGVVWERIDATAAERAAYAHVVPNHRGVIDALISSPGLRSIDLVTV
jgi:hypothetical protein